MLKIEIQIFKLTSDELVKKAMYLLQLTKIYFLEL